MTAAGEPIVKSLSELDVIASFRCADPEGYSIDLYWERV
jgi:hypothetical protein